jgi:hypothetical protein
LRIGPISALLIPLLLVAGSLADTIHFKNGTFIQVDKSQEDGDQLEYWIGSTKYTASKADIEKIDKDNGQAIRLGSPGAPDIVVSSGSQTFNVSEGVVSRTPANHFTIRYVGDQPRYALEEAVLTVLQDQYGQVAEALKFRPAGNIPVTLLMQRDFFDGTQATAWAGARDGQLRIPMQGIRDMTPALEHVLRIEVGRALVYDVMGSRSPAWLDQGLAQMLEAHNSSPYALVAVSQFQQHKEIPFADMEKPFNTLPVGQTKLAYAESLSLMKYLSSKYGMDSVLRIMKEIKDGSTPEAALRSVTQSGYAELQVQVGEFLAKGGAR